MQNIESPVPMSKSIKHFHMYGSGNIAKEGRNILRARNLCFETGFPSNSRSYTHNISPA